MNDNFQNFDWNFRIFNRMFLVAFTLIVLIIVGIWGFYGYIAVKGISYLYSHGSEGTAYDLGRAVGEFNRGMNEHPGQ